MNLNGQLASECTCAFCPPPSLFVYVSRSPEDFKYPTGPPFSFFSRVIVLPRPSYPLPTLVHWLQSFVNVKRFCLGLGRYEQLFRGVVPFQVFLRRLLTTTHVSAPPFFFFLVLSHVCLFLFFCFYTRSTGDTGFLFSHVFHRLIYLFHKTNREQTWGAFRCMLFGSRCCSADVPNPVVYM